MENTTIIQKLQAKKNKKGFTLVELVIVIAILAILAAIAIPVIVSTINSADMSTFKSNAATCEMLLKAVVNEQKGGVATTYGTEKTGDKTTPVKFESVADVNGFTAGYSKSIGGATYNMYFVDKKYLIIADSTKVPAIGDSIDVNGATVEVVATPILFNDTSTIDYKGEVAAATPVTP